MSLITCKECGKEISDLGETCPHCGCPVSYSLKEPLKEDFLKKEERKGNTYCVAGFILGALSIFFGGLLVLLPVFAVIFSSMGLKTFDETKEKNKWQGLVGLGLGIGLVLIQLLNWANFPRLF
jgi:Rieske Fe-S protein